MMKLINMSIDTLQSYPSLKPECLAWFPVCHFIRIGVGIPQYCLAVWWTAGVAFPMAGTGNVFYPPPPNQPWSQLNLISTWYQGLFRGDKRPGRKVEVTAEKEARPASPNHGGPQPKCFLPRRRGLQSRRSHPLGSNYQTSVQPKFLS
jgi:hypothetical protein